MCKQGNLCADDGFLEFMCKAFALCAEVLYKGENCWSYGLDEPQAPCFYTRRLPGPKVRQGLYPVRQPNRARDEEGRPQAHSLLALGPCRVRLGVRGGGFGELFRLHHRGALGVLPLPADSSRRPLILNGQGSLQDTVSLLDTSFDR